MKLEIINPEKRLFSGEVLSLRVTAGDGELGVLPHHARLATVLAKGKIEYRLPDGANVQLDCQGGFLFVNDNSVKILYAV